MKQTTTRGDEANDVLTLLADQHRRAILSYFADSSVDDATLEELADDISERRNEQSDEVRKKLHHADLPRLADAGVVEYDGRSKTVVYRGHARAESVMDCVSDF